MTNSVGAAPSPKKTFKLAGIEFPCPRYTCECNEQQAEEGFLTWMVEPPPHSSRMLIWESEVVCRKFIATILAITTGELK
jgi:hypothetical protein